MSKKRQKKKEKEITFKSAWMLPKETDKIRATGFYDDPVPKAFLAGGDSYFKNIPSPTHIDDWLAQYSPDTQTFPQWEKRLQKRKKYYKSKNTICLLPLGEFPEGSPSLDSIQEYCKAFYYPFEVRCLKPLQITTSGKEKKKKILGSAEHSRLCSRRCR